MRKNTWICPLCVDEDGMPREFKSSDEYMQHYKNQHSGKELIKPGVEVKKESSKPKEEVQDVVKEISGASKGITLTYKYVGDCNSCGKEVDTLDMDVGKEHFVVAWCNACKKKLAERKVVKL